MCKSCHAKWIHLLGHVHGRGCRYVLEMYWYVCGYRGSVVPLYIPPAVPDNPAADRCVTGKRSGLCNAFKHSTAEAWRYGAR